MNQRWVVGVINPTVLKGLEGMQSVQSDGVNEGKGCSAEIGKRYEKAMRKKGIEK